MRSCLTGSSWWRRRGCASRSWTRVTSYTGSSPTSGTSPHGSTTSRRSSLPTSSLRYLKGIVSRWEKKVSACFFEILTRYYSSYKASPSGKLTFTVCSFSKYRCLRKKIILWMRSSLMILLKGMVANVATVLGSIPTSLDTVECESRQKKQF